MVITNEIYLKRPIQEVWDFLSVPENAGIWQQGFRGYRLISGPAGKPGAIAEWVYEENGRSVKVMEKVNAVNPPFAFNGTYEHDAMTVEMVLDLSDSGEDTTRMLCSLQLRFHSPSMEVTAPFLRQVFGARQDRDFRKLKKVLEEGRN